MSVAGGVLALDLSTFTGWAYGAIDAPRPSFGCWRLPTTGGEGARFAAFENVLAAAMDDLKPGHVVLEAPMSFAALLGVSTMKVMAQQLTLRGFAYAEAWRASVPIQEVSADLVRFSVLGQARFAKGTVKDEVVKYCRSLDLDVPDHNAADAVLTWLWFKGQFNGCRPISGPLFRRTVHDVN